MVLFLEAAYVDRNPLEEQLNVSDDDLQQMRDGGSVSLFSVGVQWPWRVSWWMESHQKRTMRPQATNLPRQWAALRRNRRLRRRTIRTTRLTRTSATGCRTRRAYGTTGMGSHRYARVNVRNIEKICWFQFENKSFSTLVCSDTTDRPSAKSARTQVRRKREQAAAPGTLCIVIRRFQWWGRLIRWRHV